MRQTYKSLDDEALVVELLRPVALSLVQRHPIMKAGNFAIFQLKNEHAFRRMKREKKGLTSPENMCSKADESGTPLARE